MKWLFSPLTLNCVNIINLMPYHALNSPQSAFKMLALGSTLHSSLRFCLVFPKFCYPSYGDICNKLSDKENGKFEAQNCKRLLDGNIYKKALKASKTLRAQVHFPLQLMYPDFFECCKYLKVRKEKAYNRNNFTRKILFQKLNN